MDDKCQNLDPCETEIKDVSERSEINTYDSPIDPISFGAKNQSQQRDDSGHKKGALGGIYKFIATTMVIMTLIFSASELIDFLLSDMSAGNTILRRVFGSSASNGNGNLFDLIMEQTFGKLPEKGPASESEKPSDSQPSQAESSLPSLTPPSTPQDTSAKPQTTPVQAPSSKPSATEATPPSSLPIPDNAHPIITMDMSLLSYGKDYIYNNTSLAPDIPALRALELKKISYDDGPLVLVVHTHGTEAFMPESSYYYTDEGELARSDDTDENMIAVGLEFVRTLEEHGISTLHCTVMHDKESYRESYSRAAETIKWYLERYPSIMYVFDLHRDSIMKSTEELISAVTYIDGARYAQIMPVIGSGYPGYEANLAFAIKLRDALNEKYGSLSRPVCLRESQYNQALAPVSVLLEMGTSGNTLSEAKRSARLTADAIAELIISMTK